MTQAANASNSQPALHENPFAEGIRQRRAAEPCIIVLFGATGDLTRRKLVPALYQLLRAGLLNQRIVIIGFARRQWSDEEFRRNLLEGIRERTATFQGGEAIWSRLEESIYFHSTSFDDPSGFRSLFTRLRELDEQWGTLGNRLYYLATSPDHFAPIVDKLGESGLAPRRSGEAPWARVVVEKPFGQDLGTALELNRRLLEVLDESQIFRIDHYLGKETVQNILAFRFANGIFEPIWNHKYIDHVQITVAESLGVGDRGPYYDRAGALRDMAQNHMLQLLTLVAMEPPISQDANAIRDEKVKVLRALRQYSPEEIRRHCLRAQYGEGSILGEAVPAYRQEARVPPDSRTPTYIALRLEIDNWRWAGVPFFLRHGKRLPKRATEIAIQFRRPPMMLFGSTTAGSVAPNALILNIQPDEGISLCFGSKVPGPDIRIRQVKMDFRYGHSFGEPTADAYERLLLDAILGDSTLFTRRDEVEHSWRFISRIIEVWEQDGEAGLRFYPSGSWGPEEAEELFHGTAGRWRRL